MCLRNALLLGEANPVNLTSYLFLWFLYILTSQLDLPLGRNTLQVGALRPYLGRMSSVFQVTVVQVSFQVWCYSFP